MEMTFRAMAVRVLRQHCRCGDAYPEDGWPEVNAALARYAAEKRHCKQYDALMRKLRGRRRMDEVDGVDEVNGRERGGLVELAVTLCAMCCWLLSST